MAHNWSLELRLTSGQGALKHRACATVTWLDLLTAGGSFWPNEELGSQSCHSSLIRKKNRVNL